MNENNGLDFVERGLPSQRKPEPHVEPGKPTYYPQPTPRASAERANAVLDSKPRAEQTADALERRRKETPKSNWQYTPPEEKPFTLYYIDPKKHRAEMGRLMYLFPASPITAAIRSVEIALNRKLTRPSELSEGETGAERNPNPDKLNVALYQRAGHIQGIGRYLVEEAAANPDGGSDLVNAVLFASTQPDTRFTPQDTVFQVAALLEATGENSSIRTRLIDSLRTNNIWSSITETGITHDLEIPGLREDTAPLFPGAVKWELPQMQNSPLSAPLKPFMEMWQKNRADSTYARAKAFVSDMNTLTSATSLISQIPAVA